MTPVPTTGWGDASFDGRAHPRVTAKNGMSDNARSLKSHTTGLKPTASSSVIASGTGEQRATPVPIATSAPRSENTMSHFIGSGFGPNAA